MRTIRVTGKGKIKVKPDITRLTITLEGFNKEYSKTLEQSSQDTNNLKKQLSEFGFDRSDLKTLSFNVNEEFESYKEWQDGKETYKNRLMGYRFRHIIKIEFESDNKRLGKILYALGNNDLKPEFRISYTVKDPETAKNELLGKAIKDASAKAKVLTEAASLSLKDIQTIDYSWGEIDFEVRPMRDMICNSIIVPTGYPDDSYDINIEPDDIEVADTVTVVWEIA